MTQLYAEMTARQLWQTRAYGATEEQVQECLTEYRRRMTLVDIVRHMLSSAWREANGGLLEDARQTLNRTKLAIDQFYRGQDRGFFDTPAGDAYSKLSDAQELLEMGDIPRAQVLIDDAYCYTLVLEGHDTLTLVEKMEQQ